MPQNPHWSWNPPRNPRQRKRAIPVHSCWCWRRARPIRSLLSHDSLLRSRVAGTTIGDIITRIGELRKKTSPPVSPTTSGDAQTILIKWRANTYSEIYSEEIADLQRDYAALWGRCGGALISLGNGACRPPNFHTSGQFVSRYVNPFAERSIYGNSPAYYPP